MLQRGQSNALKDAVAALLLPAALKTNSAFLLSGPSYLESYGFHVLSFGSSVLNSF